MSSTTCAPPSARNDYRQCWQTLSDRSRTRREDQRRLELMHFSIAHRRRLPNLHGRLRARGGSAAAPGTHDEVGRPAHYLQQIGEDALGRTRVTGALSEDVVATCYADELGRSAPH